MNANPATEKQIAYIAILREQNGEKTGFLFGDVAVYERMAAKNRLPDKIYGGDIIIGIGSRIIIPAEGSITPADVMEMKKAFDAHITQYTPETVDEASALIDLLNSRYPSNTIELIVNWLKQHYTVTETVSGTTTSYTVSK